MARGRWASLKPVAYFTLLGNPVVNHPDAKISKLMSEKLLVYSALYALIFQSERTKNVTVLIVLGIQGSIQAWQELLSSRNCFFTSYLKIWELMVVFSPKLGHD